LDKLNLWEHNNLLSELQYKCFFLGNRWKIIRGDNIMNIPANSFYGYPFYIVFENIETAIIQLKTIIQSENPIL